MSANHDSLDRSTALNNGKTTKPAHQPTAPTVAKFCCRRATVSHSFRSPAYRPMGRVATLQAALAVSPLVRSERLSFITPLAAGRGLGRAAPHDFRLFSCLPALGPVALPS